MTSSVQAATTEEPATAHEPSPEHITIQTLGLSKAYGPKMALAGLTMSVGRGEVFGFLGPNGAGKTTAVKLLVGLSRATSGEAWVLDAPAGDVSTRRRIGYLPELFRYQDWLTGREVLELHCRLARIQKSSRDREITHALDMSGLSGRENDRVGTFSKGMQQRLGIGVALLGRPEVVFLDEPTSALDPVGRHEVREIVRELKGRGVTVFLNTHLLSEVEQVCDRVAVVDFGRVIASGPLSEIRDLVHGVRIRARGLSDTTRTDLSRFGSVSTQGDALLIGGAREECIPEIARFLVGRGVDILTIQPAGSLEESFLQLLQGGEHAGLHDRRPDPA